MIEPKLLPFILLTWVHLLRLHHAAEAQSPIQPLPSFASHHSWEPSIVVTTVALFVAFLVLAVFSISLHLCSESHITQPNPNGADWPCSCSQGIDLELIDTFPILSYSTIKDLKLGKGALECAVCLSEFKDNETLRLLPICNHVFHPDCIDAWLSSHVTCPVCRANLNQDFGEVTVAVEETQLSNNEMNEESSGGRTEQVHGGGENNEIEEYPVEPNANDGEKNANEDAGKQNRASKSKLLRTFYRSNSTGHSLVEPGKCVERYTLWLPEDVRRYILLNHGRSVSYNNVVTPMVGSLRKGSRWSDSEGSSRGMRNNNVVELRQERLALSRT